MKLITSSTGQTNDIYNSGDGDYIKINGADDSYDFSSVAQLIIIVLRIGVGGNVTNGANITVKFYTGLSNLTRRTLFGPGTDSHIFTTDATTVQWQSEPIAMPVAWDRIQVHVKSDSASDTTAVIEAYIYDVLGQDVDGRVDVGSALGTAVTLTNDQLDVNAAQSGGATPLTAANINAEVDTALDTAIPGAPTAGSVNDNMAWIKNVTEGDATVDTGATPWQMVIKKKSTDTELIRKDLKDVSGGNIAATTTVIGQQTEP